MKVAVTGSSGYIGSVLCRTLREQGIYVLACDTAERKTHHYTDMFINDSFDKDVFVDAIISHGVECIFHLAASSLLGPSATDPLLYYHNNTARLITFLSKLRNRGWKGHIIFSSTAAVYGDRGEPVKETAIKIPCNNYGRSKLMCENVLEIASLYGINVTMFRYFNVAGGYGDVGQDFNEPHIITRICNAADDKSPLVVYGNDYPTPDGTCIRDYVHVRDICAAQIHAMDNKLYDTYNLGTLNGTSVLEIIEAFERENAVKVPFTFGKIREGDPAFLVADPQKFVDTGFEYKYSNINQIVKSAWEYYNGV